MPPIFSGRRAAKLLEVAGSWLPVLWLAFACNLLAAILGFFCLKPTVARITARGQGTDALPTVDSPRLLTSR